MSKNSELIAAMDQKGETAPILTGVQETDVPDWTIAPNRGWEPSVLSTMDEETFLERIRLAKVERSRLARIQRAVMTEDVDYGVIPGTSGKPTILKGGAELLNKMAQLHPEYQNDVDFIGPEEGTVPKHLLKEYPWPMISVVSHCNLIRNREIVAQGSGSCSNWEKKYRWRVAEKICPECSKSTVIKGKEEYGGGFVCWKKPGGCGKKWNDAEGGKIWADIGMIPNPEPMEQFNTILKMAQKRAMLAATLTAHAASNIFTQDMDNSPESRVEDEPVTKVDREALEYLKQCSEQNAERLLEDKGASEEDRDRVAQQIRKAAMAHFNIAGPRMIENDHMTGLIAAMEKAVLKHNWKGEGVEIPDFNL